MSNTSYDVESEALNRLFAKMNQQKRESAEREKMKKESGLADDEEEAVKKPLQAAPAQSHPIQSEYLKKKQAEKEAEEKAEEEKRKTLRAQIERERARNEELRKQQEEEEKKRQEAILLGITPVTNKEKETGVSQPSDKGAGSKEEGKTERLKAQKGFGIFGKSDKKNNQKQEQGKKTEPPVVNLTPVKSVEAEKTTAEKEAVNLDSKPEAAATAVQNEPDVSFDVPLKTNVEKGAQTDTQAEATTVPVKNISQEVKTAPKTKAPVIPNVDDIVGHDSPKSEPKPKQEPKESKQKEESAGKNLIARGNSGMQMSKPQNDKLSITGIVPMKSDRGSKFDSAMKASNAFRTNVFLTCVYNEKTSEGAYGIVVDMGDKRVIHGMCGHTSDEWEYGFAGAIEAMRICQENNVKEIMFVVLDPLCEILQENADSLRWGYSYTRSQFTKAIDSMKREAAIGFIPEKVGSDFQDLAETVAKTLVFPVNEENSDNL